MRYQPPFLHVIPHSKVGHPRVTPPFATQLRAEALSRVRLACVRHAASVDSEPGSNSHVKDAVPPVHASACANVLRGFATFNASADDLALRCFVLEFLNRCRIATTLPADTRRVLLVVLARTI